ncbi:Class I triheme cytochrome c [Pseudooceanicola batsensis HTCC2597]|uniref:Class I triheme cytochrome c n=1 Tax=Pseudooceanicola batsensis (strain ATCC BAA-863 / DSM 15984 / KCTC 12145 / HTCC2597) TaxID=252305 RepID=A3U401_PSEBH|nr:c-type cytochrome [Pseudooceanicola batsensis]EAQ01137.1 Class I triheme cytochrome c [Pseudooceanicola batsensis HTCC2597]
MRTVLLTLAAVAALGLAGAGAVVTFGLYNVSAQAGHLPGVAWLLHTTFRNAVELRAPAMDKVPPLDDPDLIALGAGHYASACAFCHATPDGARSATARAMEPPPPPIDEAVAHWKPNELFWIVENGVKMTGMPGWPVKGREDEAWAVVAYLETVKADAAPPLPGADAGAAYCRSCHERIAGPVPRLDRLSPDYIEAQLENYRTGVRPSGIMSHAVSLAPPESFADLARELAGASLPDREVAVTGDAAAGRDLAGRGTRDVPACLACHGGEDRKGPLLHGQPEDFLATQIRLWRDGTYHHNRLMVAATRDLEDADISALAAYFASLRAPE